MLYGSYLIISTRNNHFSDKFTICPTPWQSSSGSSEFHYNTIMDALNLFAPETGSKCVSNAVCMNKLL